MDYQRLVYSLWGRMENFPGQQKAGTRNMTLLQAVYCTYNRLANQIAGSI